MTDTSLVIPDLGEVVVTVTIVAWLKQAGDHVVADEDVLEIMTEKMDVVIQSPATGILTELKATAGDKVAVGAEVAIIRAPSPR